MSREAFSFPPLLAFADPARELWGVAAGAEPAQLAIGRLDGTAEDAAAGLQTGAEVWTLATEAGELSAAPRPAEVRAPDSDPGLALVEVSGSLLGGEGAGPAGGLRHPGGQDLKADSVALLCAWFSPERAIAVQAVRPHRARGQDRDQLSAICAGEAEGMTVFDPRLSVTYGGDGLLRRAGIELWLGENEEADMFSLRMAGEATGAATALQLDDVTLQAQPFRCHSRGETGLGVYLLIRGS